MQTFGLRCAAEHINAVHPLSSVSLGLAPRPSKYSTTSSWPQAAAAISNVFSFWIPIVVYCHVRKLVVLQQHSEALEGSVVGHGAAWLSTPPVFLLRGETVKRLLHPPPVSDTSPIEARQHDDKKSRLQYIVPEIFHPSVGDREKDPLHSSAGGYRVEE